MSPTSVVTGDQGVALSTLTVGPSAGTNTVTATADGLTGSPLTFTATAGSTPPTITAVAASSITSSGATITWTTDEAADSQVEYGLTTSYGSQTTLHTFLATSHTVNLSGLAASTLYHYRVKSKDAVGNLAASGDFTFTTDFKESAGATN